MAGRARVHVVTGKGGVGKTTVAIALGRALARRGGPVLLLDLAAGLGLSAALECDVAHEPRSLAPGLDVASTDAARVVDDLIVALSPSRRAAARLVRVPSVRAFLCAAPGVLEVALLARIDAFAERGAYASVVVDADSSGHLRMLLDAPELLRAVGAAGPVRRALDAASAMLADPARARVHVVTLATALAIEETAALLSTLTARHAPLDTLFVSRAPLRYDVDAALTASLAARAVGTAPAEDLAALVAALETRARLDRFLASERDRVRNVVELADGAVNLELQDEALP